MPRLLDGVATITTIAFTSWRPSVASAWGARGRPVQIWHVPGYCGVGSVVAGLFCWWRGARGDQRRVGAGIIGAGRSCTAWVISVLSIPRRSADVMGRGPTASPGCATRSL